MGVQIFKNAFITIVVTVCSILMVSPSVQAATIDTYPMPPCYTSSSVYSLKAEGVSVPVISYTAEYDYAEFSMSGGSATIEVTAASQSSISSYWISPKKLNLTGTPNGNKLTFTISKDEYLVIIINKQKKLVIAADPGETDQPASSGTGIYNVTSSPYYADGSGNHMATTAIQNAINDASAYGGGIVYIPAGVYIVGNLQLKNNMKLYLAGGAVLRCSGNPADYTTHFHKDSLNKDGTWWIYTANGANNVKLYGRGTLDGNGYYLRNTNNYLNNILMVLNCSNFTLDGLILRDAALWGFIIARSDNSTIKNYKHFNSLTMLEDDCIDVCESQNITVQNGIGIAKDDPFSTKTWDFATTDICANWYGNPETLSNVTFDDCITWTQSAGFKIGMGTKQDQTGVTFKNSVVYDASRAISVQHAYGTATVKDITFDNIDVECVRSTLWDGPNWLYCQITNSSSLGTGPIINLVFNNIKLREMGTSSSVLKGYSSTDAVRNVIFSNIVLPDGTVATSLPQMNINSLSYLDGVSIVGRAEKYSNMSGIVAEPCSDTGLGEDISSCNNNDWVCYDNVDFGTGTSGIDLRIASNNSGGTIELRLDSATGPLIGSLMVNSTGGWQSWMTRNVPITNTSGIRTLYLVFKKSDSYAVANVNWMDTHGRSNLLTNNGFEINDGDQDQSPNYWVEWTPNETEGAGYIEVNSSKAHSGSAYLVHWHGKVSGSYDVATNQSVSVSNGIYKLELHARAWGAPTIKRAEIRNAGSDIDVDIPISDTWQLVTIDNISVTTGVIKVGFRSAGDDCGMVVDDVVLTRK